MASRSLFPSLVTLACVITLLVAAPPATGGAEDKPVAGPEHDIATQLAGAIPADLRMGTVAIGTIEGDGDGKIAHALTGTLVQLNRFKVIERRDLDKLLEEQGIQTRDWIDAKDRVRFGKVRGVQGLVFGKVSERSTGWLSDTLRVQIKLADVERGQIAFARELSSTRWHSGSLAVLAVLALLALLVLLAGLRRVRQVSTRADLAMADQRERRINTDEFSKALSELGRAQSLLYTRGLTEEAARVKDLSVQLRTLKDRIALAPTLQSERVSVGEARRVAGFDGDYRAFAESVTSSAAGLCDHASAADRTQVARDLQAMADEIRQAETAFRNRGR
jgi:hypothetical protein